MHGQGIQNCQRSVEKRRYSQEEIRFVHMYIMRLKYIYLYIIFAIYTDAAAAKVATAEAKEAAKVVAAAAKVATAEAREAAKRRREEAKAIAEANKQPRTPPSRTCCHKVCGAIRPAPQPGVDDGWRKCTNGSARCKKLFCPLCVHLLEGHEATCS
jgi:hypothetical protein